MCGIIGAYSQFGDLDIEKRFTSALERLNHRGPDSQHHERIELAGAKIIFGHTRLAILDLSTHSDQPMTCGDMRYTIIFNGEIYNYIELRERLTGDGYLFSTESDTEVLLAAWAKWGKECVHFLVGMFAFAILDRHLKTISFVRDCFGIKPLFISHAEKSLFFASELPALVELRGHSPKLNLQRSYDYLVHGDYDSNEQTFVKDINQLPPGCIQVFDISTGSLSAPSLWWNPSAAQTSTLSFKHASEKLREMFLNSIRMHLRSDVSLGAALSGGIDSSAVVCAMRHIEPDLPINTFSFIAKNSSLSEERWVDLVNERVKARAHKVTADSLDLLRDLDDMIVAQGEPFGSTSIYAQYRVFQLAKQCGVTVTLDGQGADELLAGYNGYPGKRIRSLLSQGNILGASSFLVSWAQWPGRSISHGLKLTVAEFLKGDVYQYARKIATQTDSRDWIRSEYLIEQGVKLVYPVQEFSSDLKDRELIKTLIDASTKKGLPALLRHADRNSMRFSVESRVPFLTSDIANFLFSLPEEFLISKKGETKSIFRSAMRGIVPDEILDRKDKIGFATPEYDWLKGAFGSAPDWIEGERELDFLRNDVIRKKINQVFSGEIPFTSQVWRWVNFYKWYELVLKPLQSKSRDY